MPKVFVAPGHGRKPGGTFDPGAVGQAGGRKFVEHDFNTKVANALAAALRRCNVDVVLEDGGGDHDPNCIGSTKAANDSGADDAVEVHHNAAGGSGSEVVINDSTSAANRKLAGKMADALGIRNRGVLARDREHFNRETRMPSCIPECAFVDSATDQAVLDRADYATTVAEAICEPLCDFLDVTFRPGQSTAAAVTATATATGAAEDEEGLTMADANEIMAFLQDLRQDMVVQGTPSLEVTVEKFAEHQREALAKLRDIDQRLTRIEQHLGP